jgi:hypothetical protein
MAPPERKSSSTEVVQTVARKNGSARRDAERAISEFQSKRSELSNDEAREAYAHLVIGRGFSRPRSAPVMTIHSALVAGSNRATWAPGTASPPSASPRAKENKARAGGDA